MLPKDVNQRIGQAMHTYDMLHDGDRVMIAVSGGIDSLVLMWLLEYWRRKAPIDYELLAVHLDMGFGEGDCHRDVITQMEKMGLPIHVEHTDFGSKAMTAEKGKSICYHCSRQRRTRLFELAGERKMTSIAFGHHKDDILETFFLNMLYSGNISTMVPRQDLFGGSLSIIRPMAFIEKKEIQEIGKKAGLQPVKNPCGLDGNSKRQEVREILDSIYQSDSKVKSNIFAALSNIRDGYLLTPTSDYISNNNADIS